MINLCKKFVLKFRSLITHFILLKESIINLWTYLDETEWNLFENTKDTLVCRIKAQNKSALFGLFHLLHICSSKHFSRRNNLCKQDLILLNPAN